VEAAAIRAEAARLISNRVAYRALYFTRRRIERALHTGKTIVVAAAAALHWRGNSFAASRECARELLWVAASK